MSLFILVASFCLSFVIYYNYQIISDTEFSNLVLRTGTFLFAIFTGFFIARQGTRYSSIREQITSFDGEISAIYRKFGHISKAAQNTFSKIITKHYKKILNNNSWDYNFTHKSSTLLDTHNLIQKTVKDKVFGTLKNFSIQRVLVSLENLQVTRKKMVALHKERIPTFQWALIYFLASILLITVATISSEGIIFKSALKASFSSGVILIIILLHRFDNLHFFGGIIGEKSAQDVLDILKGKK